MKINKNHLIKLHSEGLNDTEIAKIFQCSQPAVTHARNKLNLKPVVMGGNTRYLKSPLNELIQEKYDMGYSDIKIVKRLHKEQIDIAVSDVQRWRKYYNLIPGDCNKCNEVSIKGEDSLFCDTEFLESIFGKQLSKKECT